MKSIQNENLTLFPAANGKTVQKGADIEVSQPKLWRELHHANSGALLPTLTKLSNVWMFKCSK